MHDFGTFGRYAEPAIEDMDDEQRAVFHEVMELRGQIPGPYKIIIQNVGLARALAPLGAYWQGHASLSKAEIEIVTNIANGRWLAAYSNYEHEIIGVNDGKLPAEKVDALIADLPVTFEDPRQQMVYEVARTLTQPRVLPQGLYKRAVSILGHKGLTDVTVLIGYFTCISMTLMAYDVPSNAVGVER